jgi:hypothetical protein
MPLENGRFSEICRFGASVVSGKNDPDMVLARVEVGCAIRGRIAAELALALVQIVLPAVTPRRSPALHIRISPNQMNVIVVTLRVVADCVLPNRRADRRLPDVYHAERRVEEFIASAVGMIIFRTGRLEIRPDQV